MNAGHIVAEGTVDALRRDGSLEDAFVALVGARDAGTGDLSWLGTSSD
jgi:hypothetical protein